MLKDEYRKVHFIGIGGYGMSALAMILLELGHLVSGSDMKPSRLTERLEEKGAKVYFKHSSENLNAHNGCDLVIYSTAIPEDNPEIIEAKGQKLPLWHRADLLAELLNSRYGIAVAGTHGKTTTTAMLSLLLERGGLDPTAVIGGEVSMFNGNARLGNSRYLVAEACESDNSFLRYYPELAIITNIEADHLEHYEGDFAKLKEAYVEFISHIRSEGCLIFCGEDPIMQENNLTTHCRHITYGVDDEQNILKGNNYDYTAKEVEYNNFSSAFTLYHRNNPIATVSLSIPGRHNVSNATGALAAAAYLGVDPTVCAEALREFTGANRRFEIIGREGEITVVDDYAHHPTEIRATLQAARNCCGKNNKIVCVFQPHRYSRTAYFMDDFSRSFTDGDKVLLHDVYSAGEKPMEGVSSEILAEMIKQSGKNNVHYRKTFDELLDLACANLNPGDMVITMGAGDIWKFGWLVLSAIQEA